MAHPAVLDAVRTAFNVQPNQLRDLLKDMPDGRVTGVLVVEGNPTFDEMPSVERSKRMWEELRRQAGPVATQVGVIILLDDAEATQSGL